jgi:hypothetical protein
MKAGGIRTIARRLALRAIAKSGVPGMRTITPAMTDMPIFTVWNTGAWRSDRLKL